MDRTALVSARGILEERIPTPEGDLWTSRAPAAQTDDLPIVALHGGPGFPSDYLESLRGLADARDVILYDQLGCGRSDPIPAGRAPSVELFVHHLEAIRAHYSLSRFHLYGHSWGGFLALAYCARFPDRVASLIMASPLVDAPRWEADTAELIDALPRSLRTAISEGAEHPRYAEAVAEFNRRHVCSLDPPPEALQRSERSQNHELYRAMWGPNEFTPTGTLRGASEAAGLPALRMPVLWICGGEDEARPGTLAEYAARTPRGTLAVLAGGTHQVHLEQTSAYLRAIREFLPRTAHH